MEASELIPASFFKNPFHIRCKNPEKPDLQPPYLSAAKETSYLGRYRRTAYVVAGGTGNLRFS